MTRRRVVALVAILALSASAFANAAMGLALESFAIFPWIVYVCVTVVFEAYWIGVRWGESWVDSLRKSLVANAVTALAGGILCCGGLLAALMHFSIFGSLVQPRPFLDAIAKLTIFGLISAPIEAAIWSPRNAGPRMKASLVAHLIGVPIALVVLLAPPRPYVGAEAVTNIWRRFAVFKAVNTGLKDGADSELEFRSRAESAVPNLDVCLRRAEFGRFDVDGLGPTTKLEFNSDPKGRWRVRWNGCEWDRAGKYISR